MLRLMVVLLLAYLPALTGGSAQTPDTSLLSVDRIFGSRELAARQAPTLRWEEDGRHYLRTEPSATMTGAVDIVRYDAESGARDVVVSAERLQPPGMKDPLRFTAYELSADGRWGIFFTNTARVWRQNTRGDYWLLDRTTGGLRKLGGEAPPSSLMFAKLSPDGNAVAYVHGNNLYVEGTAIPGIRQLTFDGSATISNGTADWAYEEEFSLRDAYRWSPDSRWIAYWQIDATHVGTFYLINNTDSLYSFTIPIRYPKVGERNSLCRIGVISAGGSPTQWMDAPAEAGDSYIPRMDWAANSKEILFQRLNRLQNRLEVRLGDAATGETRVVHTETDSTWVELVDDLTWIASGSRFTWISERDGWRHVYTVGREGGDVRCLTPGDYDVLDVVRVDDRSGWLFFTASPANATQSYLYRAALNGEGAPQRLTDGLTGGYHTYAIAPGAAWALHTWSSLTAPPVSEIIRLPNHESLRLLEENAPLKQKLASLRLGKSEFVRVQVAPGVELDGWRILPPEYTPGKKYPVLIHVYGEPAGTTVADRWNGKSYLWYQMLAQKGYIVVSFDNRGTPAPRGRAWRKCIYRQVGILASADQAEAVRAMQKWGMVDPTRIAIWGWSGGGTMSLNAILRYPDLYSTAMAVATVPDQRLYDAIYQERFMGLPADNPEGYRLGSPITFAENLRGNLLLVHGTGDDNVHYQGAERLINALIAANKHFTMMAYPNRSHGINEGENTTRHLYTLLTRYLLDHVAPGGR